MKKARIYSLLGMGDSCVVVLEEVDGPRLLPIWIGPAEASAIAVKLGNIPLERPMTHDLLINLLGDLGAKVKDVVITDLRGSTFFAFIHLTVNGKEKEIDSRPSDAVALAARAECPIFIEERVFEKCNPPLKPISKDEVEKFKTDLKKMKPEDIFKKMGEGPKEE